ncbi:uncharacterized protein PAC_00007 [Phialocephala subalpina]|uniref:Glycosyltransferase family 92 protein n=1 Tax=Phialocephala subalpina TaxID=576137 RepID=A0A1L7WBH5_9HELO|nr:uncharacterized protein PAC_00007 [Phialocephala subalpina]
MSEFFSGQSVSWFTGIRWRVIIFLAFCLMLIHFIIIAPSEKVLEVQHKILAAAPNITLPTWEETWAEMTEKIWGPTEASTPTSGYVAHKEPVPGMDDEYVAICLAIGNQAKDLPEWLTHHYYHLGIRRFYIMDDGSEPPISEMEDFGIPRSALTFTYQDREDRASNQQTVFYDICLRNYGSLHHWIAFFDADEFLEVTSPNETFRGILEQFETNDGVGALGVSWKVHTSNGLLTRPESCRKSFTTCIYDAPEDQGRSSDNRHVKSLVRPSKAVKPSGNPHKFDLVEGAVTVGEHGDMVVTEAFRYPVTRDRLALHHYAVKSKEEYEEKLHRGNGMTDPKKGNFWEWIETMPHTNCTEMVEYDP